MYLGLSARIRDPPLDTAGRVHAQSQWNHVSICTINAWDPVLGPEFIKRISKFFVDELEWMQDPFFPLEGWYQFQARFYPPKGLRH